MTGTLVAYDPSEDAYVVEIGNPVECVYFPSRSEANAFADDWGLWEAAATHGWRCRITELLTKGTKR
jgi:hypothetical protein